MESTRIAVVQMKSEINMIDENLKKIKHFIDKAHAEEVNIICFPELCINGYSREKAGEYSERIPGPSSLYILDLAIERKMTIIAGVSETNGTEKPFITQFTAFPDGRVQKYRKTHLGISEKKFFSAGDSFPVFNDERLKFGVQLCWEMHFPEITTVLSINGCELVFAPHASPVAGEERREIWLKYLTARAYDNSVYIAACNLVGYDGEKQDFGGGTIIIDPKGNVINECFDSQEKMITATLKSDLINKIRTQRNKSMRNSFYLTARRPELYGDIIKEVTLCELETN